MEESETPTHCGLPLIGGKKKKKKTNNTDVFCTFFQIRRSRM